MLVKTFIMNVEVILEEIFDLYLNNDKRSLSALDIFSYRKRSVIKMKMYLVNARKTNDLQSKQALFKHWPFNLHWRKLRWSQGGLNDLG